MVKLGFSQIMAKKADAEKIFYETLFAIAPDTRPMFKSGVIEQSRKFIEMLVIAVGSCATCRR